MRDALAGGFSAVHFDMVGIGLVAIVDDSTGFAQYKGKKAMFLGAQLPIIATIGHCNHQTMARRKRMGVFQNPEIIIALQNLFGGNDPKIIEDALGVPGPVLGVEPCLVQFLR